MAWIDENNNVCELELFFNDGLYQGQSKGLRQISQELGFSADVLKMKLDKVKEILLTHKAFQVNSKLEVLAHKYNVKIIFLPKFHCELNPIEGLWCFQKGFVRCRTNQNFDRMVNLIYESREAFIEKNMNIKLWRRFWRCIYAYKKGFSYGDVLKTYFSGKSKEKAESHRKIYNTML